MGPGAFYQLTRYKDAEAALRDDKTFSSSINGDHIGQFGFCATCHLQVHSRFRNPHAWQAYREAVRHRFTTSSSRTFAHGAGTGPSSCTGSTATHRDSWYSRRAPTRRPV